MALGEAGEMQLHAPRGKRETAILVFAEAEFLTLA